MPSQEDPSTSRTYAALAGILLLSLTASLALSRVKLLWEDELFEFYSDTRPTFLAILHGQQHFPFSLEPPAFHLLLHLMHFLPLRPEISTRIPSALALLITQWAAFSLTRALTKNNLLALATAALPLVLATFDYSAEARVYSTLTACYALSFLFYQRALAAPRRSIDSFVLFLTLSACVLLHYYGILLLLPFLVAELFSLPRKHHHEVTRWRTLLAIFAAFSVFTLNLPFLAALREIQATYYDSGEAHWDMAPLTYLWLLFRNRTYHLREQGGLRMERLCALALCLLIAALYLLWNRSRRAPGGRVPQPLLIALAAGLLIPIANLTVGIYHAHAYTPRYSLPVVFPILIVLALALEPLTRSRYVAITLLTTSLSFGLLEAAAQIHATTIQSASIRSELASPALLNNSLTSLTDRHLYVKDLSTFLPLYFYAPTAIKNYLVEVESVPLEEKWDHSATTSLFARNMRSSTSLPIQSFQLQIEDSSQPHLLLIAHPDSEWPLRELAAAHWTRTPGVPAFGATLIRVDPPASTPPAR